MTEHTTSGRGSALTWAAGLVVATGAGVATAHGLFQVAAAAGVPAAVAWLYPLITDGLALVAYAATARLHHSRSRRYAAAIVVLAAGLSGLAQAVYLAGGIASSATPVGLRFGVGAWPALAAAIAAHLLHLINPHTTIHAEPAAAASNPAASNPPASNRTFNPSNLPVSNEASNPGVQPRSIGQRPTDPGQSDESGLVDAPLPGLDTPTSTSDDGSPRQRAIAAATAHRERHGALPTVSELAHIAGTSRGTAGNALKDLRTSHPALHLITTDPHDSTTKTTST
jgi:hypothetical protein